MKRALPLLFGMMMVLTACVDTTGINAQSSKPSRGNPQSNVVVTEFGDLQCPSCRSAQTIVVQPILATYGSQIRFEFKNFPLRSIHRYALDLAEASECAADQGKYWQFVDMAYEKQPELANNSITDWAKSLGLDMDLFGRCTRSHIKRPGILAEYKEGQDAGVQGTPTFFVNGQQVASTVEAMSAAIDAALKTSVQKL